MAVPHKQPPFAKVAAGSPAHISNLDMGDTCDSLIIRLKGTDFNKDHINGIFVGLGGKDVIDGMTGPQLHTINSYIGRNTNAQFLALHFTDPNSRTIDGESMGGIDTSLGYSSFTLRLDIDESADAPELDCWMFKSRPKPNTSQYKALFRAFLKTNQDFNSAKAHQLSPAFGSDAGVLLARLHMFHQHITRLDVKKNGVEIQGEGDNDVIQFMQNELNRVTQAGHLCYDPLFDNLQSNAVSTVKRDGTRAQMSLMAHLSEADNIDLVSEVYAAIDRI